VHIELRLPNITEGTPQEQLQQIKRFLYSTIEQLNFSLQGLEKASETVEKKIQTVESANSPSKSAETFGEIKDLIIKDADIVKAYEEEMKTTFDKEYVASSEFGDYKAYVTSEIASSADGLRIDIEKNEEISSEAYEAIKEMKGYVKIGILGTDENGNTVLGMEIKEGTGTERPFARYTAAGTVLYNENGSEAVTLADGKTKLTGRVTIESTADRRGSIEIGDYLLDPNDGLGLYWIG
jgi:hypothetical protein